jgi:serine/threonine protein kinase
VDEQSKRLSRADWENLEQVIDRFVHAWQQGQGPILEHHLPPPGPGRRAALIELVHTDQSSTLTREGTMVGTPDYMAPEQTLNAPAADIPSDINSLGCTLYHLLTGTVPFPGKNLAEKLLNQQVQEPRPLEQLRPKAPAKLRTVLRKMMAKQAEERYQTPGDVAAALEPWSARS